MGLLAKYFGACACLGGGDAAGAAASPAADTAGADGEGGKKKAARDDEGASDADALAGGWDRSPRRRRTASSASARGQQEVDGELFYDALAVSQRSGSLMGVGSSGSVGASLSSFTRTVSAAGGAMAGTVASAARAGGLLSVNEETGAHSLHVPGEEQAKRLAKIATRAVLGQSEASKQRARARMELREAKDVEALRVEVIKRGALAPDATEWHSHPLWHSLRRFLRARDGDVNRAAGMFCDHARWRREYRADSILEWFNEDFAEKDAVRAAYPSFYLRQDKLGRPVYVERIGLLNLKELTKVTSIERLVTYHVFEYEALLKHHFPHLQSLKPEEERWDDKSVQSMTIVDLKGVNLASFRSEVRDFIGAITKIDQANYPELLGNLYVINTPLLFRTVWAIVRPMIDEDTVKKIHIYGKDYKRHLHAIIDRADLPPFLGGTDKSLETGVCMTDKYLPKPSWRMTPEEREAQKALAAAAAGDGGHKVEQEEGTTTTQSVEKEEAQEDEAKEEDKEKEEWFDVPLDEGVATPPGSPARRAQSTEGSGGATGVRRWETFKGVMKSPVSAVYTLADLVRNGSAVEEGASGTAGASAQQGKLEDEIKAIQEKVSASDPAHKPHRNIIGQVKLVEAVINHGLQQTDRV